VDYKGQFRLGNGQYCYPLTVTDNHSRYLLGCQGLAGTLLEPTKAVLTRIFKEYGLPSRIRSDNGVPFAAATLGRLSQLSVWWIKLGILPELIEPGKPQQNGRHERMHKTLKDAVTKPPAYSPQGQQRKLNVFRHEYNVLPDLHAQRVEEDHRVHRLQRSRLPGGHFGHGGVGDGADELRRHLGAVLLGQEALDLAHGHAARVHGHDLVVEAGEAAFVLGDEQRLEAALTVSRHLDAKRPVLGQNRLAGAAVAMVAARASVGAGRHPPSARGGTRRSPGRAVASARPCGPRNPTACRSSLR